MGLDMGLDRVKREELHYWRKANAIRGYFASLPGFVDNGDTFVSREQLEELLEKCKEVLDYKGTANEVEMVEEILPPTDGFFFGSTEINDWYWDDIEETKEALEKIIPTLEPYERVIYWEWY